MLYSDLSPVSIPIEWEDFNFIQIIYVPDLPIIRPCVCSVLLFSVKQLCAVIIIIPATGQETEAEGDSVTD